jgi:aspartate aminotransferase-like enzyme
MKFRLLTPGPTPVPEETLLELAKPMIYHRSAEFREYLAEVLAGLQHIFATQNAVLPLSCSGTGSLEAALVNSVPAGKKAIVLSAGKFGDRWISIANAFGIETAVVRVPWGQVVTPTMLEAALGKHPDAVAVCSTLSETSTGAGHDIEAFGKIVAKTPAILLVDGISGIGAMECRCDAWSVDVACVGSQKALMMPPGVAFVSVSSKAWSVIERNTAARTFYLDLKKARKALETGDTPYTPAHTLLRAMRLSVRRLVEEGIENVWRRQDKYASATRGAFQAIGVEIFPERPNPAVTVVRVPPGIDGVKLLARLETGYGIKLAGGQDDYKGKIVRLTHMGYVDQFDILAAISGMEYVLAELGHRFELGAGVAAFHKRMNGR